MKQSEISLTKLRVGQCDFDSLKDNKVLSSTLKCIHIYIHNNTNKHIKEWNNGRVKKILL